MTDHSSRPGRDLDELPTSAWALGLVCLVAQLVTMARRGLSDSDAFWVVLSMALTAAIITWVSTGVMRARLGRLIAVWVLFGLELVAALLSLVLSLPDVSGGTLLDLGISLAQVAALAAFCSSDYFRRQRSRPPELIVPPLTGMTLLAVTVGALGGLTAVS